MLFALTIHPEKKRKSFESRCLMCNDHKLIFCSHSRLRGLLVRNILTRYLKANNKQIENVSSVEVEFMKLIIYQSLKYFVCICGWIKKKNCFVPHHRLSLPSSQLRLFFTEAREKLLGSLINNQRDLFFQFEENFNGANFNSKSISEIKNQFFVLISLIF